MMKAKITIGVSAASSSAQRNSKNLLLLISAFFLPMVAGSIPFVGAVDTQWPKEVKLELQLNLSATVGTNDHVKISGDLLIKNSGDKVLTIRDPHDRLALTFLVLDPLGNPVVTKGIAKVNPSAKTHIGPARSTYTHRFESLDFLTGSALFGYDLSPGNLYRVVVIYRPAGPFGPGFTSQETKLEIPLKDKQQ